MKTNEFPSGPRQCDTHTFFFQSFIAGLRCLNLQPEIGGLPPASNFSLSDVDVGDALQFINHISHRSWVRASYSALSFSHVDVGDAFQFDV